MNELNTTETLRALHETYCRLTGLDIRFGFECESLWFSWHREGYTQDDLEITIAYIQRLYCKQPRILAPCLRLHKLIGDLLNFGEMRAEACKVIRVREENAAKESVLRATGRTSQVDTPAESAGQILQREALIKALQEFKKTL